MTLYLWLPSVTQWHSRRNIAGTLHNYILPQLQAKSWLWSFSYFYPRVTNEKEREKKNSAVGDLSRNWPFLYSGCAKAPRCLKGSFDRKSLLLCKNILTGLRVWLRGISCLVALMRPACELLWQPQSARCQSGGEAPVQNEELRFRINVKRFRRDTLKMLSMLLW